MNRTMVEIPDRDYAIGATQVTQAQWRAVMGSNPSHFKGEDRPVELVSWYDAVTFCNKLSELERFEPCYVLAGRAVSWPKGRSCTGYRLPTEAEWEYAARAGQDTTYAGSNELGEVAWCSDNSDFETHPVAQKKPNAWGLYDMSGNVWEWVWDGYGGSYRVFRGGSWGSFPFLTRVADRSRCSPSLRGNYLGLRLARTI